MVWRREFKEDNNKTVIKVRVIITYRAKYKALPEGETNDSARIHPRCPIEEYARSGRSCDWFIPIKPPIKDAEIATSSRNVGEGDTVAKIRSLRGAIFCHVVRRMHIDQGRDAIVIGNQKWAGGRPILITSPVMEIIIR